MIPGYLYRAVVKVLLLVGFYDARNERYSSMISPVLPPSLGEGALVLDLGCGPGNVTSKLPGPYRVIGVDKSRYLLRHFLDPRIPRVQALAEILPFRGESIDAVVAISLVEHIADQGAFFSDVARVLRPGGYFVLQLPELNYPIEPHTKWPFLLKWSPSFQSTVLAATGYADLNLSTSVSNVPRQCAKSGLIVEQTLPIWHLRLAKLLGRPMGYCVIIRKPSTEHSGRGRDDPQDGDEVAMGPP